MQLCEIHWLSQTGSCKVLIAMLPAIKAAKHVFVSNIGFCPKSEMLV